jgi:hypothetical protein
MKHIVLRSEEELARIPEVRVMRGTRAYKRAAMGQNVARAVQALVAVTGWPEWFASNVVRWRLRHGMAMAVSARVRF